MSISIPSPRRVRAWLGFAAPPTPTSPPADKLPPDLLEPIVEPSFGIDGWSYVGTPLEECFSPKVEAELAQAVHMICAHSKGGARSRGGGLATAWNYRRAAQLLEASGAYAQAYAVLEAWAAQGPDPDPGLPKWRARLAAVVLAPNRPSNKKA